MISLTIVLTTFFLEDLALAGALALVGRQELSFTEAFLACFLGITLGDLGLYAIGAIGVRWFPEWSWLARLRAYAAETNGKQTLASAIVASRVIPGTRLPTYLAAGLTGFPFGQFFGLTVVSVALWVGVFLFTGHSLLSLAAGNLFLSVVVFLTAMILVRRISGRLVDPWNRKAWLPSWRRYGSFEFWPAWAFYVPIGPWYLWLGWKHRDVFAPFRAQPRLAHGGLIGESKWEFLRHLAVGDPSTLTMIRVASDENPDRVRVRLREAGLHFPLIAKPDVGQRGFAVRVIANDTELTEYLSLRHFDVLFQRRSSFSREAGLFYVRPPGEEQGFLFSITDKQFPTVTGDGRRRLGDLILRDPRARMIASTYFARHRARLDEVLLDGEVRALSECGNHCQGAIFLNGAHLNTPALTAEVDRLARSIPDFRFGRFDVRYRDEKTLVEGRGFEIVEINGAGSEATHIWDARTKLIDAYKTLFRQWEYLFAIGAAQENRVPVRFGAFLRECFKVARRNERLSVSS